MDLATADDRDDRVPGLLQRQPLLGDRGMILRHLQEPRIAEEVRCVQQVDVEAETLDPLAAVDEPAQIPDRAARRSPRPQASSIARTALIWYAIGQMPQIREVMSGASVNARPRRNASKNRGGS